MRKIILVLSVLLVVGMLAIVGCKEEMDIPEEMQPPEEALAGQAVYMSLTAEQLAEGVQLDRGWNAIRWPAELREVLVEEAIGDISDSISYVYGYSSRKYYIPKTSRYARYIERFRNQDKWLNTFTEGKHSFYMSEGATWSYSEVVLAAEMEECNEDAECQSGNCAAPFLEGEAESVCCPLSECSMLPEDDVCVAEGPEEGFVDEELICEGGEWIASVEEITYPYCDGTLLVNTSVETIDCASWNREEFESFWTCSDIVAPSCYKCGNFICERNGERASHWNDCSTKWPRGEWVTVREVTGVGCPE